MSASNALKVVPFASGSSSATSQSTRVLLSHAYFKTHKFAAGDTLVLIPALSPEALAARLSLEENTGKARLLHLGTTQAEYAKTVERRLASSF